MRQTIDVDAIKEGVDIVEVLKTAGLEVRNGFVRSFLNSDDNTPSLKVYLETNSWYDFSTGEGGDVIRLYETLHGVDFVTACKELNERFLKGGGVYGQTIPKPAQNHHKTKPEPQTQKPTPEPNQLYDLLEYASIYPKLTPEQQNEIKQLKLFTSEFHLYLAQCRYSHPTLCLDQDHFDYLANVRGFQDYTIIPYRLFSISLEVVEALKTKHGLEAMQEAGLYNDKGWFVFTKHRLATPFLNEHGRIYYLQGRAIDGQTKPKIKNLFRFTKPDFFNLELVRSVPSIEKVYIAEGAFDTLALWQMGIFSFALLDSNTGNFDKLKPLKGRQLVIATDNDKSGETAKGRLINYLYKHGFDLKETKALERSGQKDWNDLLIANLKNT